MAATAFYCIGQMPAILFCMHIHLQLQIHMYMYMCMSGSDTLSFTSGIGMYFHVGMGTYYTQVSRYMYCGRVYT